MKKLLKFLKVLLAIVLSIILLIYGTVFVMHKWVFPDKVSDTPTVSLLENGEYKLGVQLHEMPQTLDGYVRNVLAEQIKRYNETADQYWNGNHIVEQYVLIESIENGKFWLIAPNGEVSELTRKQAEEKYKFSRQPYRVGFDIFEGDGISGMYAAASEEDMKNYLMFEEYPYLGTYDVFITYTHELFHIIEQPTWNTVDKIQNAERSERFEDMEVRAETQPASTPAFGGGGRE